MLQTVLSYQQVSREFTVPYACAARMRELPVSSTINPLHRIDCDIVVGSTRLLSLQVLPQLPLVYEGCYFNLIKPASNN